MDAVCALQVLASVWCSILALQFAPEEQMSQLPGQSISRTIPIAPLVLTGLCGGVIR